MTTIPSMQRAIREEGLDGWLFCNFHHRDALTDELLQLDVSEVSSRRWFYLLPPEGEPIKIVHAIEQGILDSLPGIPRIYSSREELETILSILNDKRLAVLSDPFIQVLSTMDAASWNLVRESGARLVSAAPLMQRAKGLLDARGFTSHDRAADALHKIVHDAWDFVGMAFREDKALTEGDVLEFMLTALAREGLETDHPPIVAGGSSSADPHYTVRGKGKTLRRGEVLQFDIWAKYPGGIYADISWVGFLGSSPPPELSRTFEELLAARDQVKIAIEAAFAEGKGVTGAELDARVRDYLLARFPAAALRHRTGHGIDTDCHGSGVNLDSVEFPDRRYLLEGSCFSVEPGIYFDDFGFRTEIDISIRGGRPVVSGPGVQRRLLTL